jgi:broad specificity phosphatase PhoE
VVGSIEQALEDNDVGSNIVVVTHAGVVRVLLARFTDASGRVKMDNAFVWVVGTPVG